MAVPVDSGKNFINQNGHRMKKFTLLPLVRAVQDLTGQGVTEKFDWPSVDIVTDRGRLRKLLAWAGGLSDKYPACGSEYCPVERPGAGHKRNHWPEQLSRV